ncbi:MAG: hypothetical protein AVDCRST_MAG87-2540, partial [uncultured Thermomicrobiales bacterium]
GSIRPPAAAARPGGAGAPPADVAALRHRCLGRPANRTD